MSWHRKCEGLTLHTPATVFVMKITCMFTLNVSKKICFDLLFPYDNCPHKIKISFCVHSYTLKIFALIYFPYINCPHKIKILFFVYTPKHLKYLLCFNISMGIVHTILISHYLYTPTHLTLSGQFFFGGGWWWGVSFQLQKNGTMCLFSCYHIHHNINF